MQLEHTVLFEYKLKPAKIEGMKMSAWFVLLSFITIIGLVLLANNIFTRLDLGNGNKAQMVVIIILWCLYILALDYFFNPW